MYPAWSGILSVVVCLFYILAPAYISVCRGKWGLDYLLKVRCIILVDPNGAGFLISSTFFHGMETLPYVWKIYKKWAPYAFGSIYLHQTFTECMFNQYTHFDISTFFMKLSWILWKVDGNSFNVSFKYIISCHECV